ncbi:hypothetical protein [Agromyces bauzanensis]
MGVAARSAVYLQPEKIGDLWVNPFTLSSVGLTAIFLAALLLWRPAMSILAVAGLAFAASTVAVLTTAAVATLAGASAAGLSALMVIFTGYPIVTAVAAALFGYLRQKLSAPRRA